MNRACRAVARLFLLLLLAATVAVPAAGAAPTAEGIAARLGAAAAPVAGARPLSVERLRAFYAARGFRPAWSGEGEGRADAERALAALGDADSHGLDPARYHAPAIGPLMGSGEAGAGLDAELLLSDGLMRYLADMGSGRVDPSRLEPEDYARPAPTDGVAALAEALRQGVAAALAAAPPPAADYERLRRALADLRRQAAQGPWPNVPDGDTLRPGDAGPRTGAICRRLAASGETRVRCDGLDRYDAALARDVRAFQARHGLAADGAVGAATLARLNRQASDLADQVALNMERWRWLPADLGRRHVMVDMAGFDLRVVEDERTVMSMPIVVGRAYFHTPVFSSAITHLVLNPTWHVPPRIAREVLLPKIRQDPGYLAANGFRVFTAGAEGRNEVNLAQIDWSAIGAGRLPYVLRQRPGAKNALGQIKFELPNPFAVYLHDTPDRALFQRRVRAFSSGCIRLERAADLALYLLQDRAGWAAADLDRAIAAGETRTVTLATPVAVHLTYFTAHADGDGGIHFNDDIYGRDEKLRAALARVN